jgi:hypothetical protein
MLAIKIIIIVLTLVFLFSCNPIDNLQQQQQEQESIISECKVPLELVILIDESNNIEINNIFDDIIFKSIEIIDNLRLDFKEMKVSVLSYSNKINEIIIWSENIQLIKNKLLNMNSNGRRPSGSGSGSNNKMNPTIILDKITSVFLRTDFERIKMTLWFTDASNLSNDDYIQVKHHSKMLKSISHLFLINTTNKRINENKLKQLASSPKSLFNLNTLNLFYKLISDITSFACKRKVKTSNRLLNKNNNNNNNNSLNKSNAIHLLLDLFGY